MSKSSKIVLVEKFLKLAIKEAYSKNILVCGINEISKKIIEGKGLLCILAKNCQIKNYRITVKALCWIYNIKLILIRCRKKLGRICKLLERHKSSRSKFKIIPCSVCLIMKKQNDFSSFLYKLTKIKKKSKTSHRK